MFGALSAHCAHCAQFEGVATHNTFMHDRFGCLRAGVNLNVYELRNSLPCLSSLAMQGVQMQAHGAWTFAQDENQRHVFDLHTVFS